MGVFNLDQPQQLWWSHKIKDPTSTDTLHLVSLPKVEERDMSLDIFGFLASHEGE